MDDLDSFLLLDDSALQCVVALFIHDAYTYLGRRDLHSRIALCSFFNDGLLSPFAFAPMQCLSHCQGSVRPPRTVTSQGRLSLPQQFPLSESQQRGLR